MKLRYLTLAMSMAALFCFQSVTFAQQLVSGQPLAISGTSGGTVDSGDCGYIATTPNHLIQLPEDFPYVRFLVQTQGAPTLLIQGPGGRYCVLPGSDGLLQFSGYGTQGNYQIFIGDRNQGQHSYRLSVSDQRQ